MSRSPCWSARGPGTARCSPASWPARPSRHRDWCGRGWPSTAGTRTSGAWCAGLIRRRCRRGARGERPHDRRSAGPVRAPGAAACRGWHRPVPVHVARSGVARRQRGGPGVAGRGDVPGRRERHRQVHPGRGAGGRGGVQPRRWVAELPVRHPRQRVLPRGAAGADVGHDQAAHRVLPACRVLLQRGLRDRTPRRRARSAVAARLRRHLPARTLPRRPLWTW
jgi:hypothetical protein